MAAVRGTAERYAGAGLIDGIKVLRRRKEGKVRPQGRPGQLSFKRKRPCVSAWVPRAPIYSLELPLGV